MDPADPTTPPPPRLNEFRPGTLIVVFDAPEPAQEAATAIAPMSDNDPYVLAPDEVIAQDAEREAEAGVATRAYKFLTSFLSDQNSLQARYVHLARGGASILVAVARDDDQAAAIWSELKRRGGHDGSHFAGPTIRELV
jgi:hypothetical protein